MKMKLWKKLGMPKPKSEASKGKLSFVDNEIYSGIMLPAGMPFFVRLDGWAFHHLAKEIRLKKPLDKKFAKVMVKTASGFFIPFNPCLAYIFSDEINLLFLKQTAFQRVEKIDSVFAGLASSVFSKHIGKISGFDCRCIPLERKDIIPYLIWRQAEAFRNCNNGYAQYLLMKKEKLNARAATKKLQGMKTEKLIAIRKKYLKEIPEWHERGILVYRERYKKEGYNPIKKKKVIVERLRIVEDWKPPIFAEDKILVNELIRNGFL